MKVANFTDVEHHIKENTIIMPKTNKKGNKIEIKLSENEIEIYNSIEFKTDYLLNINSETKEGRSNSYGKLIKKLTEKYFGEALTQTQLRKCSVTDDFKKNEWKPVKEQIEALTISAAGRNHSLDVALRHYLQDSHDINVNLKVKSTLNIVDDNGHIQYSYDLKEIITNMEYHKLLKKSL